MTKASLDIRVSHKFNIKHGQNVSGFSSVIIEHLSQALECGKGIEIRGFGTWGSFLNLGKRYVNPKTLVSFIKPRCVKFRFKPSPVLLNLVNKDKETSHDSLGTMPDVPEPLVEDAESLEKAIEKFKEDRKNADG